MAEESPNTRPTRKGVVKVFLVNRRDLVRRGLHAVVNDSDDLEVVGEAMGPDPDLETVSAVDTDVAIVDAASAADAVALVRTLHEEHHEVPVVILGDAGDDRVRRVANIAGADEYLPDDAKEAVVHDAVRRAARGEQAGAHSPHPHQEPHPTGRMELISDLTYREHQVLRLIAQGLTNRQIGEHLGLAEKTVKNYISTLLAKLHVARRTQAAIYQIAHEGFAPRGETGPGEH
jgi:DNA-binding NarL/FixJ family response regulator